MQNKKAKKQRWSLEKTFLVACAAILAVMVVSAWGSVALLRSTIASYGENVDKDVNALIEIERIRNMGETKTAGARAWFLLGSKAIFDEQAQLKKDYEAALAGFEKRLPLPQVPEIIKKLTALEQQHQEFFDQGMKFREEKTESKIVGQFFQSKVGPLRKEMHAALDELSKLARAELAKSEESTKQIQSKIDTQLVGLMTWFTALTVALILCLMLLVIRMVGQRSRHQSERDRLFEQAKKAVQSRDELMAAISHDLKEPLAEINQAADSLVNFNETSNLDETVESIKRSVAVTDSMIRDILDQAKSDEGSLTLRLDQLEINDTLGEARFMLEPLAKKRDVRLQFDSSSPPVLAFFDRERVFRVLLNLVGNAIKFSPKHGKVAIRVRSDQQFAYISIADNGPGIPEKNQSQIFTEFWQAPKTAEQGAGVGLAVVKNIIEAHGGTVKVESQPGSGSTFTFSLPRRRPAGAVIAKTAASIRNSVRQPTQEL